MGRQNGQGSRQTDGGHDERLRDDRLEARGGPRSHQEGGNCGGVEPPPLAITGALQKQEATTHD